MKAAIDIETYEKGKPVKDARKFVLGILLLENGTYYVETEPEELWKRIQETAQKCKEKKETLYLYGHYHCFDFSGYAQNHLFDVKHIVWTPFLAIQNNIYYCDTLFFFPTSLEEIGKEIGLPKLEMPEQINDVKELEKYCLRDCQITLKAIQELEKALIEIGMKPNKMITAGQESMTNWQTYIKKRNLHYGTMKAGQIFKSKNWRKIRYAYRGARCQAFKTGRFKDAYLVDVKSMYPHIMSTMRHPDLQTSYYIDKPKQQDYKIILDCIGVAKATIKCPVGGIGLLPVYFANKQVYPTQGQTITGIWTLQELKVAQEEGYTINELHWAECYFDNEINPFTEYMEKLYEIKEKSKGIKKRAIKLLMNNLYAKFAQIKMSKEIKLIERNDYEPEQGIITGVYGTKYVVETAQKEMIRSFHSPLITARVTAGARIKLYYKLKAIPKEDLLYCDTDSVVFKNKNNLIHFTLGTKMGDWELQEKGEAIIKTAKAYKIGNKISISGLLKKQQTEQALNEETETCEMISLRKAIMMNNPSLTGQQIVKKYKIKEPELLIVPKNYDETNHYT